MTEELITSGQRKQFKRLAEDTLDGDMLLSITKKEAQRALMRGDEIMSGYFDLIRKFGKNPHDKVSSNYDYPKRYNGAKDLEEQATILREQYQFPLKPLASVKQLPEGAEGLWVIPCPQWVVPLQCEHPYNYVVDFVLERLGRQRDFKNWRQGETGHLYLRQHEHALRIWSQLALMQGSGELTPVVPAQFGRKHRGESVGYAREDVMDNEFFLGAYHVGVMLLTHPEREVQWEQLHVDCAGDEFAPFGDSDFSSAPYFFFNDGGLEFDTKLVVFAGKHYGAASAFLPQAV